MWQAELEVAVGFIGSTECCEGVGRAGSEDEAPVQSYWRHGPGASRPSEDRAEEK